MKKTIRLTESDLTKIIKRIVSEQSSSSSPTVRGTGSPTGGPQPKTQPQQGKQMSYTNLPLCKPGSSGKLVQQGTLFALSSTFPFCKIISTQPQGGAPTSSTGSSSNTTRTTTRPPSVEGSAF